MLSLHNHDISNITDVNKTSASNECISCHYWYFPEKAFKFQSSVCNSCHDVLMVCIDIMCIAINSITILNIHGVDYYCIIFGISKREAINLFKIMLIWVKIVDHYKILKIYDVKLIVIMFGDLNLKKVNFTIKNTQSKLAM